MAKLVFGMNQSLDGYVDHTGFAPGPTLFRHFIEEAQGQAGSIYGRRMYETWYKMTVMLQGGLDIRQVITHHFDYSEFEKGFEIMKSGQSGKVILKW